ncbi:MAG: ElyC/SanA/YdcF family protein [Candidatus Moraniibacteriota bacterium]
MFRETSPLPAFDESRRENGAEELRQKTRIVVMLGARLSQKGEGNEFSPRFPLVLDAKKAGMPKEVVGGDSRMRAIEQLYHEFEEGKRSGERFHVFTTGGIEEIARGENEEPLRLSRATEAERKLEQKYGLPEETVESLSSGGSTVGNAAAVARWAEAHQTEREPIRAIEIVTNEFHMSRAWLMFSLAMYKNQMGEDFHFPEGTVEEIETLLDKTLEDPEGDREELEELRKIIGPFLENIRLRIQPQVVEDILKRRGPAGEKYAELIEQNRYVQETRAFERQGIKDLIHGKYQVK